jgi:Flp pilus assembly protein TadD
MPSMTRLSTAVAALLLVIVLPACASLEASQLYRSGTAALDRGDAARAVADLERAAVLAPDAAHIQNHLGIAYEQAGRRDAAVRAYERAVALDCENESAQANLAKAKAVPAEAPLP